MTLSYNDRHPLLPNLMGYAEFEVKGYTIQVWQPANGKARREFVIEVRDPKGEVVREDYSPMIYPNTFGVDVADKAALDNKLDQIVLKMGLAEGE